MDKPDKKSRNPLVHFGATTFDPKFFALYMISAVVIWVAVNFILDGRMTEHSWWFSIIGGSIVGVGMYFWDLKKAQKKD